MTKAELIEKVKEVIAAPSCCPDAKAACQAYLDAVGTDGEKAAQDAFEYADAAEDSKEAAAGSAGDAAESARQAEQDYTQAMNRIAALEDGRLYIGADKYLYVHTNDT